jgi:hypothetical protein
MPSARRVQATFTGAAAISRDAKTDEPERGGVLLAFRPHGRRLEVDAIEDFADLGPELTLSSVEGLGKVLRLLRAARIAPPADALDLIGQEEFVAGLLERAVGTRVQLEIRPRSRLRFVAWTEGGVETVDHVLEVVEADDAWLVLRNKGRIPVRLPRERVLRQRTELERWYEVLQIERLRADG